MTKIEEKDFNPESLEEAKQIIADLQSKVAEHVDDKENLSSEIDDLEEDKENLEENIEDLQGEVEEKESELNEAESQVKKAKSALEEAQETKEAVVKTLKKYLAKHIVETKSRFSELEEDEKQEQIDKFTEEDYHSLLLLHNELDSINYSAEAEVEESEDPTEEIEETEDEGTNKEDEEDETVSIRASLDDLKELLSD